MGPLVWNNMWGFFWHRTIWTNPSSQQTLEWFFKKSLALLCFWYQARNGANCVSNAHFTLERDGRALIDSRKLNLRYMDVTQPANCCLRLGPHLWEKLIAFPQPRATLQTRSGTHSSVNKSISEHHRILQVTEILGLVSSSSLMDQISPPTLVSWTKFMIISCRSGPLAVFPVYQGSRQPMDRSIRRPILEDMFSLNFKANSSPSASSGVSSIFLHSVRLVWAAVKSWRVNCKNYLPAWPLSSLRLLLKFPHIFFSYSDLTITYPLAIYLLLQTHPPALAPLLCIFQSWAPASLLPCTFCLFYLDNKSSHLSSSLTSSLKG